jgi:hypothetical protein
MRIDPEDPLSARLFRTAVDSAFADASKTVLPLLASERSTPSPD